MKVVNERFAKVENVRKFVITRSNLRMSGWVKVHNSSKTCGSTAPAF